MGRAHGETRTVQAEDFRWSSDRFALQEFLPDGDTASYFGSEAHRSLLESIVVAQTGKSLAVIIAPGQGSKTDMRSKIWVDPEQGGKDISVEDKMIFLKGVLRHECLHITVTNAIAAERFHRELDEIAKEFGSDKAQEMHWIWNALEDAMIETWAKRNIPGGYKWIEAMRYLQSPLGKNWTEKKDKVVPWDENWIPVDAQGNDLKIVDASDKDIDQMVGGMNLTPEESKKIKAMMSKTGKFLFVPAGTEMPFWTDRPAYSLHKQAMHALMAQLPMFEAGDLHPKVQAAMDEARPYIDAAINGGTADCAESAKRVEAILRKHGLVKKVPIVVLADGSMQMGSGDPDSSEIEPPVIVVSMPDREAMEQAAKQQQQSGGGQSQQQSMPQNPMPNVPGQAKPTPPETYQPPQDGSAGGSEGSEGQESGESGQEGGESGQAGGESGGESGAGSPGGEAGGESGGQPGQGQPGQAGGKEGSESGSAGDDAQSGAGSAGDGKEAGAGANGETGEAEGDGDGASGSADGKDGKGSGAGEDGDESGDTEGKDGKGSGADGDDAGDTDGKDGKDGKGSGADGDDAGDTDGDGDGASGAADGKDGKDGKGAGADGEDGESELDKNESMAAKKGDGRDLDPDWREKQRKAAEAQRNSGKKGNSPGQGAPQKGTESNDPNAAEGTKADENGKEAGEKEGAGDGKSGDGEGKGTKDAKGQSATDDSPLASPYERATSQGQQQPKPGGGGEKAGGADAGQGLNANQGGNEAGEGYDPVIKPPQTDEYRNEILESMRNTERSEVRSMIARKQETNRALKGSQHYDWKVPDGNTVTRQRELVDTHRNKAQTDEIGKISTVGFDLAARYDFMKLAKKRPLNRQKRGRKVEMRSATRLLAGATDVMMTPGRKSEEDAHIEVVVDLSGSTQGWRTHIYRMAMMMGYAATKSNVPTGIWGYQGSDHHCEHTELKSFDSDDLSTITALHQVRGGGTPTSVGMEFAIARLAHSKAKQKMLVVITDGASDNSAKTRAMADQAQALGIDVFANGFNCDDRQMEGEFGPGNWVVIEDYSKAPDLFVERFIAMKRRFGF
jgi:hypothetical protein